MAISRSQLLKELEPGLNALFGLEYDRYDDEQAEIFDEESSDRAFEEEVMLSGFGQAPVKGEGAAVTYDTANEAYTARYTMETIALAFAITEEAVEDNLYAIAETLDWSPGIADQRVGELLEIFGLSALRKNATYTLSGGERRRLEIARSMVVKPDFVLLDEPFAGIDPLAVLDIQKIIILLKESNIGVLITDHNVRETLKITSRAYIIREGTIFKVGTPDTLSSDIEVRKVYLGEKFQLY